MQACEAERLGAEEGSRARVGRCGLGPEAGRTGAARGGSRVKRGWGAGCRAGWGGGGTGGGRSRQPLEPKGSRLHSGFFSSHLGPPSTPPYRFLSFKTRERCLPSPRPPVPGASPLRMPQGEKGSRDGGFGDGKGLLPGEGSGCCPSLQGERFQGWAPGHRGCRGLPASAAQRAAARNAKRAVGCPSGRQVRPLR